jgi:phytoene/squalene synthetase
MVDEISEAVGKMMSEIIENVADAADREASSQVSCAFE